MAEVQTILSATNAGENKRVSYSTDERNKPHSISARTAKLAQALALLSCFYATAIQAQVSTAGSGGVSPSGGFNYSIPIRIPPGTTGVQPSLSLSYSSQGGNGIAGVGWNVSGLSVITRCPATQATDGIRGGVNLDANDKLCMDGQRLMVQTGSYGQPGSTYVTEIFNGNRITQVSTTPTLVWRAPSPSYTNYPTVVSYSTASMFSTTTQPKSSTGNQKTTYASSSNDIEFRVETKAGELMEYARADLAATGTLPTRMWLLVRVVDTYGNYWTVDYARDSAAGEYLATAINYTGNAVTGLVPYNKVQFDYEARTDTSVAYLGGLKVSNTKRLTTIRTLASLSGSTTQQKVTEYKLSYSTSVGTQRSLLSSVQEFAYDAAGAASSLNPITFTYNNVAPSFADLSYSVIGLSDAASWNAGYRFWAGEVNGDGKTDLITRDANGVLGILQSTGSGLSWLGTGTATGASDPYWNEGTRWFSMDFDGDGKTDMVLRDGNGMLYLYRSTGTGFVSVGSFATNATDSGGWNTGDRWFTMDFDGDGRMDLTARDNSGNIYLWRSTGTSFEYAGVTPTPYTEAGAWMNSGLAFTADVDGDGKTDFIFKDPSGGLSVWLSTGTGFVNAWYTATGITDGTDTLCGRYKNPTNRLFMMDVNGDGKADAVMRATDGTMYVLLSTGKQFVTTGSFASGQIDNGVIARVLPANYNCGGLAPNRFFPADFNGDGLTDLIVRTVDGPYQLWQSNGTNFNLINTINLGAYNDMGWSVTTNGTYRFWSSDVTGDGKGGMIARDANGGFHVLEPNNTGCTDCMVTTKTSLGLSTTINYESLAQTGNSRYFKELTVNYPQAVIQPPMYVVGSVYSDNAIGTQNTMSYWYGTALSSVDGRGFLGFNWVQTQLAEQPNINRTYYAQTWPFTGAAMHIDAWQSNWSPLSATYNNYKANQLGGLNTASPTQTTCAIQAAPYPFVITLANGTTTLPSGTPAPCTGPIQVYTYQTDSYGFDLDGTALPGSQTATTVDGFGSPLQITTQNLNSAHAAVGYTKTIINEYINDTTNWWIGRLKKSSVTSNKPAN
jgi:FG-GAP-like repeat/Salmonella virulence plasmid 65kDa B protein/Insecticide toxin TcdB middle/N-terminal region